MCFYCVCVFFFKQKTAYEMRISDWSSDVCSSDLRIGVRPDMAAVREIAVGLLLGEGRIREQRGRQRLQREPDAEFLRHIGFGRVIEIDLDRAGPKHHVEPQIAQDRKSTRLNSSH